ncbi:hypothetical protein FMM05_01130 [Flavobacterium zepuense]|uniref:Uncharacterized protein n=1 Tax=Flavobacterium zepuense TaxID=2593302 RepID=A0A552V9X9_9FLAO|nr:hypothetical protein [Flavobacterium zepuense]TRW27271.1 hypothetical protein FMM05_01130 [Flavobacterium zepuense]
MQLSDVTKSIKEWGVARGNSQAAIQLLSSGNYFEFKNNYPTGSTAKLHAYLGLNENLNGLNIYIIPAQYDNAEYVADIMQYITVCKVLPELGNSHQIPETEAKQRIAAWDADFNTWIPRQIAQPDGLFQAFYIPGDYMTQGKNYDIYFALEASSSPTGFTADLIVTEASQKVVSYYDTVRPVPPFDVFESDFYLLDIALATV